MRYIIYTTLLVLFVNTAFAQNKEFTKEFFPGDKEGLKAANSVIKEGDKLYMEGEHKYTAALNYYLAAQNFNPDNAELNYKIGMCYYYSSFKVKCFDHFKKAYDLKPTIATDIRFFVGRGYHLLGEWDKAIGEYNASRGMMKSKDDADKLNQLDKLIQECNNGKELQKKPARVFIDNLSTAINTKYPEYGPIISADESVMYFTSRRDNTTGGKMDEYLGGYYEDIYVSYKQGGKWTPAVNIGPPINTNEHDATISLFPDGQKMFVYKDDKGDGNIYETSLVGNAWSKPQKVDKNINTSSHESSACLSPDGKTLYFVSNRPDLSIGGRDIYMSTKDEKGRWMKPINLGSIINTPYNEESVFLHPDGKTLYFSSQGHNSMGGYDIYKTVNNNGIWSKPENMGWPINTPDDDVFFVLSASGRRGYYSSFRSDGQGEKDIYVITFLGPEKPVQLNNEDNLIASLVAPVRSAVIEPKVEVTKAKTTILKGTITDAITQKVLEANIELIDNVKNQTIAVFTSNATTGKYLVSLPSGKNYGIAVKAEGYLFHSENFDLADTADYQEVIKDIQLKNVAVGSKIVLKNIFFDYAKYSLRPESTNELERLIKLLNDVPSMRIEISGHTDNRGSAELNQKLSENRAKSVVDYLVSKGISASRLEYKGYGKEQPVATNDTDAGRQENRRTEFKILSK
jgi:outer membrane protein OmpA-like peptidoglycan-associated protein/Tol biopolymer transport system component